MPSGAMLRDVRPLDDIRRDLDAGPDEYESRDAARVLGVQKQTLATWRSIGRVTATPHNRTYTFTRDALWRLALDIHGVALYELDGSDEARAAVKRMLAQWGECAETVQQLHDAAGVRPLPPPSAMTTANANHRRWRMSRVPVAATRTSARLRAGRGGRCAGDA